MDKIGFNRATYNLVERFVGQVQRLADEVERYNDEHDGMRLEVNGSGVVEVVADGNPHNFDFESSLEVEAVTEEDDD